MNKVCMWMMLSFGLMLLSATSGVLCSEHKGNEETTVITKKKSTKDNDQNNNNDYDELSSSSDKDDDDDDYDDDDEKDDDSTGTDASKTRGNGSGLPKVLIDNKGQDTSNHSRDTGKPGFISRIITFVDNNRNVLSFGVSNGVATAADYVCTDKDGNNRYEKAIVGSDKNRLLKLSIRDLVELGMDEAKLLFSIRKHNNDFDDGLLWSDATRIGSLGFVILSSIRTTCSLGAGKLRQGVDFGVHWVAKKAGKEQWLESKVAKRVVNIAADAAVRGGTYYVIGKVFKNNNVREMLVA